MGRPSRSRGLGLLLVVALAATTWASDSGATWPRTEFDAKERVAIAIDALERLGRAEQIAAIRTLERHRKVAVPALLAAAEEKGRTNPYFLYNVLGALRQLRDPAATPLAAKSLAEGGRDYPLRRRAALTIGACGGPKAVEALEAALSTDYIPLAIDVVNGLIELRAKEAGPAILARARTMREIREIVLFVLSKPLAGSVPAQELDTLVTSEDPAPLRAALLQAKGRLGDEAAWKELEKMAASAPTVDLRLDHVARLLEAGRPAGRTLLAKLLDDDAARDRALLLAMREQGFEPKRVVAALADGPEHVRFQRIKRVAERLDEPAIRAAVTARFLDPEENPSVRIVAANALVDSGVPEAWAPLVEMLKKGGDDGGPNSLTYSVGCALSRDEATVPVLIELVGSEKRATARGALAGLLRRGGSRAAKAVLGRLGCADVEDRVEAANVLGLIGTAHELEPLRRAWERESDAGVRAALAAAAERIARSGR